MDNITGNLLVVTLDLHPSQKLFREGEGVLSHCINSLLVFCNSHLLHSPQNKLAVIASSASKCVYLYPTVKKTESTYKANEQYELFAKLDGTIENEIKQLILESSEEDMQRESLLYKALAMALCYINRMEKEESVSGLGKLSSRILVISASLEGTSQYMSFMNVFFAAQKRNIVIDACILGKDVGLLQQGCDITGGIYLKIIQIAGLLQYLMVAFLPDISLRKKLALPIATPVDYRAACFCHRNLIDIGYVCSVCLSVFCTFSPICSTCETTFKLPNPMTLASKKKKKTRLL
ncbi:RNA polymerase II transcription factor B subunit 4 [Chamberlinius hualienensis]